MSCYSPLIGIPTGEKTENGKEKYLIRKADSSRDPMMEANVNNGVLIPCGKCIGCRLDYSRKWADRMMLELETEKKGVFLTLTYRNEDMHWSKNDEFGRPIYGTLDKRDCQLFMKRLRKSFPDVKIRFFLAGEYGENTLRPHYHCILYGIGLDDIDDLVPFGRNELGQHYYISRKISKIWKLGNILIADVSWKTCAYVARYVTKKLNGDMKKKYEERNCIPEFSLMSRRPGIGGQYLKDHPDCLDNVNINISTPEGGRKISIPKYYIKKKALQDPEWYDRICAERRRFASDKMLLELSKTDKEFSDYMNTKENVKKAKIAALKRR